MWSGPRNISTAMMRSFGARGDCAVTDEPFYGAYLRQTGAQQPMADAVIAAMECDWATVAEAMRGAAPGSCAVWYQKHMPHHMVGPISIGDFPDHRHAFLIRHPAQVVASYAAKRVEVSLDDLGYARQSAYFEAVAERGGIAPPVIDSGDVLADPEGMLRALCAALGIPWDRAMLRWASGVRSSDGIWSSHWYGKVAQSTGFSPPQSARPTLTAELEGLVEQAFPFYESLYNHAIGA